MLPWEQPQKWDSWMAGVVMLTSAMADWLQSPSPSPRPSVSSLYTELVDPISGRSEVQLNANHSLFRQMTHLHKHLFELSSDSAVRSSSILRRYPKVPDVASLTFDPLNRTSDSPGPFRPPTPGADVVQKKILLDESQRVSQAEASERKLLGVFQREPTLNGLCFPGVMIKGGCIRSDCDFCRNGSN